MIAYGVTRRTKKIGIRMALGAQLAHIGQLIAREGILLAVVGIAIGAAGAWALRRVLAGLLNGVSAEDPLASGGAALVLLFIPGVATLIPARHALRVDPAMTIRAEQGAEQKSRGAALAGSTAQARVAADVPRRVDPQRHCGLSDDDPCEMTTPAG